MAAVFDLPVIISKAGAQPTPLSTIQSQVESVSTSLSPGLTANLPGSMVDDLAGTTTAGIAAYDQGRVDTINSISPNGTNDALLIQMGSMLGVYPGTATNTSVPVVFAGTVGYVIPNGFLVGDGVNVYRVLGGAVINSSGVSQSVIAVAVNAGAWAVPENTVTALKTSVPSGITLSVNNPAAGTPAGDDETMEAFRARVMQANLVACVGTPRCIKTLLSMVPGVNPAHISVQSAAPGIKVVCSGGDPYDVAYAVFMAVGDPTALAGSGTPGRNSTVSIIDSPDTFSIVSVIAPSQTVTLNITWDTLLPDFTAGAAFQSLVQQPIADYINGLGVGQVINILEMNNIFQQAVSALLDPAWLTSLSMAVSIDGTLTPPESGTSAVRGDPEGYFFAQTTGIAVTQA